MSCFYANAGSTDQKGPCDLDHLIHLYKIKEINEDTLLWTEGMLNWEPMKSCKIGNFVMQPEKFDDYDVDNDDEEDSDEEGGDDQSLGASVKSGATLETMDTAEYDGAENLKIDFFLGPPPPLSGILSKMASGMIKNWKKRHFVLEKGSMMYYEPVHLKLRGRYNLLGLGIVSGHLTDSPETIRLHSATRPDICLTAATPRQRKRWANALQQHIQYANYLSDVKKGLVSAAPALSSSGSSGSAKNGESSSSSEPRRSMRKLTIIEVSEDGNSAAPATSLRHSTVVTPASAAAVPNEGVMASAVAIRRTSSGPDVLRRSMTASSGPQVVEAELCLRNTTLISGNDNTYTNIARPATGYNAPPLCEGWLSKQGESCCVYYLIELTKCSLPL